jgi:hypothetical protein
LACLRTVEYLSLSLANHACFTQSPNNKRRVSFPYLTHFLSQSHSYSYSGPISQAAAIIPSPSLFPIPKNRKVYASYALSMSINAALKQSTTPQPRPSPPSQPSCSKPCTSGRRIRPTAGEPRLRRHLCFRISLLSQLHSTTKGLKADWWAGGGVTCVFGVEVHRGLERRTRSLSLTGHLHNARSIAGRRRRGIEARRAGRSGDAGYGAHCAEGAEDGHLCLNFGCDVVW